MNWYLGNYLESPNNALREDNEDFTNPWTDEIDELRKELSNQRMTHKQFLDLMKEKGIHGKYYKYEKYVPDYCPICEKQGFRL